jgi:hypothetical protein
MGNDFWLVAIAIVLAGWLVSQSLKGVQRELERLNLRFWHFAFEPDNDDPERGLGQKSQLRWIARTIRFHRSGEWSKGDYP